MLSVVTLVRNRNTMLTNFLRGWSEQTLDDLEVIVVRAGGEQDPTDVCAHFDGIGIRNTSLPTELDDDRIAYSYARNAGASMAAGEHLVFCDADTIPDRNVGQNLHDALDQIDGLLTVDVHYLPPGTELAQPIEGLADLARPHPNRPTPPSSGVDLSMRHEMVWGLCMAMRSSTFREVGKFDQNYGGYAGEDTDLARAIRDTGRLAGLVGGATVLHQHHDSFEPPLHQMEATVLNAERYRSKWGEWPMEGWLAQFERLGFIKWNDDHVEVLRSPSHDEIEAHRCRRAAPFRPSA